jgi:hypothetical protein
MKYTIELQDYQLNNLKQMLSRIEKISWSETPACVEIINLIGNAKPLSEKEE